MRPSIRILLLLVVTFMVALLALAVGSESIPFSQTLASLKQGLGLSTASEPDPVAYRIVWQLRLPRVLLAGIVGGGLSIVGVAMQTLVRNPLAEPYILGLSSGASAGASLFYLGFLPPLISRAVSLPSAAFAGALFAMVVVFLIARTGGLVPTGRLLLAGVAVSAFLGAVTAFVTFASPDPQRIRAVLFWLLGSLSGSRWTDVVLPAIASGIGLLILLGMSRSLDAFLSGEESASSLGVSVERLKIVLVVVSALVTGMMVAASGVIGFVGLIVPHAVRFLVGVSHRRLLPAAYVSGALFLVLADLAARTVLTDSELPIGVLTAVCGVPFFLVLLRRAPSYFA